MLFESLATTPKVAAASSEYCNEIAPPLPQYLTDHQDYTAANVSNPQMMISALEAKTLTWLARDRKAKRVLEIGCFSGFSALAWVEAMGPDSKVVTCDVDTEMIKMARQAITKAGKEHQITIVEGPAERTMQNITEKFDIIFIDANKEAYTTYFDTAMDHQLLTPNGIIICDNVLMRGLVALNTDENPWYKEPPRREIARSLDQFNRHVAADKRVDQIVLPIFDGLSLIRQV